MASPPDPREFASDIPPHLGALILRLMSKTPEERFDTTGEVVARLEKLVRQLQAERRKPAG